MLAPTLRAATDNPLAPTATPRAQASRRSANVCQRIHPNEQLFDHEGNTPDRPK
jgi:hypothetical protein